LSAWLTTALAMLADMFDPLEVVALLPERVDVLIARSIHGSVRAKAHEIDTVLAEWLRSHSPVISL
jgi:hypothetical protein